MTYARHLRIFANMTMMVGRLLRVVLALVFAISVTMQGVPSAVAQTGLSLHTDMEAGCDGMPVPMGKHMPNCVRHIGCVCVSALPMRPFLVAIPFGWTPLDFLPTSTYLTGISIEPELSPPILTA